jgi:tripartite-type tricarboxylate transporter receptor subunit TctC
MSKLLIAAALTATLHGIGMAAAQVYPSRPITVIVPYAAGGSTSALSRIIAERMQGTLGQPVIVENVPGAAGSLGVGRVARAAADGHTLALGSWSTHVANGAVYALPYDVVNDFEPVALLATSPLLIATKKTMPASNLNELIAWLKANPDKATQGTNGAGSIMHLAGVLFQRQTGTHFRFVPYRGGGPTMQDLVAGQIDMLISQPADILPQSRSGNVKAYAVASARRIEAAPDIPTVDEAGLPGFYMSSWLGLWAPKRTRREVIARLNVAVVEALADPAVRQRLTDDLDLEIPPRQQQTPEALGAFQRAEIDKWWPIIKAAGIRAE